MVSWSHLYSLLFGYEDTSHWRKLKRSVESLIYLSSSYAKYLIEFLSLVITSVISPGDAWISSYAIN